MNGLERPSASSGCRTHDLAVMSGAHNQPCSAGMRWRKAEDSNPRHRSTAPVFKAGCPTDELYLPRWGERPGSNRLAPGSQPGGVPVCLRPPRHPHGESNSGLLAENQASLTTRRWGLACAEGAGVEPANRLSSIASLPTRVARQLAGPSEGLGLQARHGVTTSGRLAALLSQS